MGDVREVRVKEQNGQSQPIRTSYPVGIHKRHVTVPLWPAKRPVPRSRAFRNVMILAAIAIAWIIFLNWANWQIMIEKYEQRQRDFVACKQDRIPGFCPYRYGSRFNP